MTRETPFIVVTALWAALSTCTSCEGGISEEERRGILVVQTEGPLPEGDGTGEAVDPAFGTGEPMTPSTQPDASLETARPLFPDMLLPDPMKQVVGSSGSTLVTGSFEVEIPGLGEETEVEWVPLRFDAIWEPRPLSTPLVAVELRPYGVVSERMLRLTLPLRMPVPQGMTLQLLAFNRSMDAFIVADECRVSEDGLARFQTDLFSQYVVVARPQSQESACQASHLAIEDSVPDAPEQQVTGAVEEDQRMGSATAHAVLSDMRYFPGHERILYKNEERRNLDGNGLAPHDGEDYLFDPRLAAGLDQLGHGVLAQWTDPVSEGPAFQLRITEGFDSLIEHSPVSNHYRGRAADLTLSPVPAANPQARREFYGAVGRLAVCAGFDFVDFEDRYHIHVSTRPTRVAYLEETPEGREIVTCDLDGTQRQVLARHSSLPLDGLDVRALSFSADGRALNVFGRRKGIGEAYRIDLETIRAETMPVPVPLPRSEPFIIIDASLRIEARDGRILVQRPTLPSGREQEPLVPRSEPFYLTPEGTMGWHPAIWDIIESPVLADGTGPDMEN